MQSLQSVAAFSEQGPLVAAMATAVLALATATLVLWRQNQKLFREMLERLETARKEAVERENRVHATVERVQDLLDLVQALPRQSAPPRQ